MANPVFVPGSERGRHRRPRRRVVAFVAAAGLLCAFSLSAAAFTGEKPAHGGAGCPTVRVGCSCPPDVRAAPRARRLLVGRARCPS